MNLNDRLTSGEFPMISNSSGQPEKPNREDALRNDRDLNYFINSIWRARLMERLS